MLPQRIRVTELIRSVIPTVAIAVAIHGGSEQIPSRLIPRSLHWVSEVAYVIPLISLIPEFYYGWRGWNRENSGQGLPGSFLTPPTPEDGPTNPVMWQP
jgi:hypothetical protein